MATNYANERLTTAIKNHLLSVDTIPPTAELSQLAGDLAEVCLTELTKAGLGWETVENLFAPPAFRAQGRGIG